MTHTFGVALEGPFFRGHLIPPFVPLRPSDRLLLYWLVQFDYSLSSREDRRKGYSYPGNDTLAQCSGFSPSTVKKALAHLQENVYIVRTIQRRGRGHRDFRFIHINYGKLEHGHQLAIEVVKRRNRNSLDELEARCIQQFESDDIDFLTRLVVEGKLEVEALPVVVRKTYIFRNRRLIDELSNRLAGCISIPSIGDQRRAKAPMSTAFQPLADPSEEDEVRNIRRSRQISGVRETRTAHLHSQQQATATQATTTETDEWRPIAVAIRDELIAAGLAGETLEQAVTIALHFCRDCCIAGPTAARSVVQSVLESVDWDEWSSSEVALSEFAYELSSKTGCY